MYDMVTPLGKLHWRLHAVHFFFYVSLCTFVYTHTKSITTCSESHDGAHSHECKMLYIEDVPPLLCFYCSIEVRVSDHVLHFCPVLLALESFQHYNQANINNHDNISHRLLLVSIVHYMQATVHKDVISGRRGKQPELALINSYFGTSGFRKKPP